MESIRTNWKEMGLVVRLSTIVGLVCGGWGIISVSAILGFVIITTSTGPLTPYGIFEFLLLTAAILLSPLIAFVGSILLLVRPMTLERRGVVGFISLVSSLLSIVIVGMFVALALSLG